MNAGPENPRKATGKTLARESSLVDFLDRAQKISILASDLGRAFQTESPVGRPGVEITRTAWNRHKAVFEKYWQALLDLAPEIENPPEGSGSVATWLAEAAQNAREMRRLVNTSSFGLFWEYFPILNSVAWELHRAIEYVQKTLNSVDPFAFLDKSKVQECEAVADFSLLDRYGNNAGEGSKSNAEAESLRGCGLLVEPAARAGSGGVDGATTDDTPGMKKPKQSTERGEGRTKLIAALTKHHQYADGGCLNLEPIGSNALARMVKVSVSTASAFFTKEFGGHTTYRAACNDASGLVTALKLLNQEFSPHHLFGATPPGERDYDDEE